MAMTQFAMVEELAFLIKDNLHSKHLILSTEEAMINFLQEDTRSAFYKLNKLGGDVIWKEAIKTYLRIIPSVEAEVHFIVNSLEHQNLQARRSNQDHHTYCNVWFPYGILELQPMSPYDRLLSHRLSDIFGFAHESVGEGDNRHLVLERCPETSIPPVLVSDILWEYDDYESPASSHHILRREASALKSMQSLSLSTSLEDREAAYQAARDRIFAIHKCEEKDVIVPKPRNDPVVARRMIAHALGRKIRSSSEKISLLKNDNSKTAKELNNDRSGENYLHQNREVNEMSAVPNGEVSSHHRKSFSKSSSQSSDCINNTSLKKSDGAVDAKATLEENMSNGRVVDNESLQKEQMGAAKRIFAHALGLPSGKGTCGLTVKSEERGRAFRRDM